MKRSLGLPGTSVRPYIVGTRVLRSNGYGMRLHVYPLVLQVAKVQADAVADANLRVSTATEEASRRAAAATADAARQVAEVVETAERKAKEAATDAEERVALARGAAAEKEAGADRRASEAEEACLICVWGERRESVLLLGRLWLHCCLCVWLVSVWCGVCSSVRYM